MTDQALDDVLAGKTDEAEPVEPTTTDMKVEATKTEPEPDTVGDKSAPPADEDMSWTKQMALDERRKRQEAEARLKALEDEVQSLKRGDTGGDDTDQPSEVDFETRLYQERANITRALIMEKHQDYEEMEKVFIELTKQDPSLIAKIQAAPIPAKFAYETAKAYSENKRLTDPAEAEKLKAEIRAQVLAELGIKDGEKPKAKSAFAGVPDIVNATSATSGNKDAVTNETLSDIFKR